jgi:hypothetical protein
METSGFYEQMSIIRENLKDAAQEPEEQRENRGKRKRILDEKRQKEDLAYLNKIKNNQLKDDQAKIFRDPNTVELGFGEPNNTVMFEKMDDPDDPDIAPDDDIYKIPGDDYVDENKEQEYSYIVSFQRTSEYNPDLHTFEGIAIDEHNFVHYIFLDPYNGDFVIFQDEVTVISDEEIGTNLKDLLDNFEYLKPGGTQNEKDDHDKKLDRLDFVLKKYNDNEINIIPFGSTDDDVKKIDDYLHNRRSALDYDIIGKIKTRIREIKSYKQEIENQKSKLSRQIKPSSFSLSFFSKNDTRKLKEEIKKLDSQLYKLDKEIKLLSKKQRLAEKLLATILKYRNLTYLLHRSHNADATVIPPNTSFNDKKIGNIDEIVEWESIIKDKGDFISRKKNRSSEYYHDEYPEAEQMKTADIVPINFPQHDIVRITKKKYEFLSHNFAGPSTRNQVPNRKDLGSIDYDTTGVLIPPGRDFVNPITPMDTGEQKKGGKTKKNKKFSKTQRSKVNKKFGKTQKSKVNKKFGKTKKSKMNKK